jgi:membrane protein
MRFLPSFSPALRRLWQFALLLRDQCRRDKVIVRASGLAYVSLLAVVPLMAVLFALFSGFGAFDQIEAGVKDFLVSQFLPARQDEIVGYLDQFTANARQLGFLGFILLMASAVLLLDAIEKTFNEIWHVRARRRLVSKLSSYTSVLVFGTLFMGASLTVWARLETFFSSGGVLDRGFVRKSVDWSLPTLLTLTGFLVVYLIVPYARVSWKSAALGAAVGGVLWELAKNVFADTVGQSVRYSAVYGSLAVFPIFLVWLYVTWVILLLGLEIAFTHQHLPILEREHGRRGSAEAKPVVLALKLFARISKRFYDAAAPPTVEELSQLLREPLARVERTVRRLVQANLVRDVVVDRRRTGLVPATSLKRVRVADVVGVFLEDVGEPREFEDPAERAVEALASEFWRAGQEAVGETTFEEIVSGGGQT